MRLLLRVPAFLLVLLSAETYAQPDGPERFFSDTAFAPASISFTVRELQSGREIFSINPDKSLTPASVQKLVTTAAALELIGQEYRFSTTIAYSGILRPGGILDGDIWIKGGGDPSLGSERFFDHYGNLTDTILIAIQRAGIKSIKGSIIADDSMFDFNPAPAKWVWEDLGNYYGAGAYGISVYDNTFRIALKTGPEGSTPEILSFEPSIDGLQIVNNLTSSGTTDRGYVFSAPYGIFSWIAGTVPVNRENFVLKASIPDPPQMMATMIRTALTGSGVKVSGDALTARKTGGSSPEGLNIIKIVYSPTLADIIKVLNHESVNLYAEHLVKYMGYNDPDGPGRGTTSDGIATVMKFLESKELPLTGIFLEDGSGVSPLNGLTAAFMAELVRVTALNPEVGLLFRSSLPAAGREGTMKNYFRDPLFEGVLRAKTGSMTRVRSFAGIFRAASGKEYVFCYIVN
ncbi:MAG: D-alanyl-D-alanine carboxypeptidase/D-alanyl-D-alanine-endopeptidase, partial [Bacteroidales bacterium]|nr:D-alanyl-D-alanine carboxypeptidase/D-alanyl-D-alanine-endopeptidase [Bacteroidales bacterium]